MDPGQKLVQSSISLILPLWFNCPTVLYSLKMSNRHNIAAIANVFPLASIESGRKSLLFQNHLYFFRARQSHVRTSVQDSYSR